MLRVFVAATCVPFLGLNAASVLAAPRCMKITFSGYARSETLTNFPALVLLGGDSAPAGFSYAQFASTNGWDLRFQNARRTRTLNHEIENWNTNGVSPVWVQVPMLGRSSHIWACWGRSEYASSPPACTTNGSTWFEGFAGVWHMNQTNAADSSPYRNDGSASGTVVRASGTIDGAARFAYHDKGVHVPPAGSLALTNRGTLEAWVFATGTADADAGNAGLVHNGDRGDLDAYGNFFDETYSLQLRNGNTFALALREGGYMERGVLHTGRWHHVVGSWNESRMWITLDGVRHPPANSYGGTIDLPGGVNLGSQLMTPSGWAPYRYNCLDGVLDEVRISAVARSTNWAWATWMSVASNRVFSTYGPVGPPWDPLATFLTVE